MGERRKSPRILGRKPLLWESIHLEDQEEDEGIILK
jgi:hypothetical protein